MDNIIIVKIGDCFFFGIDFIVYIVLYGNIGWVMKFVVLDNFFWNDFE